MALQRWASERWARLVRVGGALGLRPGWIWAQWGQRLEIPMEYSV